MQFFKCRDTVSNFKMYQFMMLRPAKDKYILLIENKLEGYNYAYKKK